MLRAAVTFLMCLFLSSAALAQKRIALLIGNKDYKPGVGALVNPLNDIRVVGDALRTDGFEILKPIENGSRAAILRAIHDCAGKLREAESDAVGFLYYSGHGNASAGENYLIPVDVERPSTVELDVLGVKHSEVLAILRNEAPNAAHYLVLDACRNTLQGMRGGKGFDPIGQQSGVLVAFAAEPGRTASDTGSGSGPYAAALAAELVKPGQNDLLMFHNVRVAVIQKTSGDQVPWTEDGIQRTQRMQFGGGSESTQAPTIDVSEAAREWSSVDRTSIAELETYLRRHGGSLEANYARARLEELKKKTIAMPQPPNSRSEDLRTQFNGEWRVTYVYNDYCRATVREFKGRWTITDGVVVGGGGDRGNVSTDGDLRLRLTNPTDLGKAYDVTAHLSGSQGRGKFQIEGRRCGGNVIAQRR
jgi:hypothetical protein